MASGPKSSVQFSRSVVSDSLRPHESQHARPPCPSPTPGVHSDSHPSSQWCHPAISSSVVPFSSCPQSLPASVSFPVSQLFAWGGQSTGVSALASVLPMNTQGWSPLEWTCRISLQPKGLSRVSEKEHWLSQVNWWLRCKESACNAGDTGLIHVSGRHPGERNGYPLQYSYLENLIGRGAWRAMVHGVAKSRTQLSD